MLALFVSQNFGVLGALFEESLKVAFYFMFFPSARLKEALLCFLRALTALRIRLNPLLRLVISFCCSSSRIASDYIEFVSSKSEIKRLLLTCTVHFAFLTLFCSTQNITENKKRCHIPLPSEARPQYPSLPQPQRKKHKYL